MADTKQSSVQRILSIARFSLLEVIFSIGIIIILALTAAISVYLEELAIVNDLRNSFSTVADKVGTFLDTQLVTNVVTLFFWGTIGLLLYSLCWSLFVMFFDIRSDIVVSQYFVHPRSFHKSNFWIAALSRRIIIITSYLVIFVYIVLLLRSTPIVYGSVRDLFTQNMNNLPSSTMVGLLALGSWLLGWHLIFVVRRLSVRLTKEV